MSTHLGRWCTEKHGPAHRWKGGSCPYRSPLPVQRCSERPDGRKGNARSVQAVWCRRGVGVVTAQCIASGGRGFARAEGVRQWSGRAVPGSCALRQLSTAPVEGIACSHQCRSIVPADGGSRARKVCGSGVAAQRAEGVRQCGSGVAEKHKLYCGAS